MVYWWEEYGECDAKADTHYTVEEIQTVVDECNMVGIPVWSTCWRL